jgi:hypothetical protein
MIRKMLVIAAAVAMPISAIAAVTTAGVAGAAAKPAPQTGAFPITGAVTFAAPGLSAAGSITSKTVEDSSSSITPSGFGGTKAIKSKIPSNTTPCWSTLPVYNKTSPVGGTLASGAASACDVGGASAAGDPTIVATDVKTAIKDQYSYDSAASFAGSGTTAIVAALNAKPIKLSNNGNSSVLTVTDANSVLPGGDCGAGVVGFEINGTTTFTGASNVTIRICLTDDTGPSTTDNFFTDLLGTTATIATATIGGLSQVEYSA